MVKNDLTIRKGCFNCIKHMKEYCNLTHPDGTKVDVMKIQNNNGKNFRAGCCCGEYEREGFKFR